MGDSLDPEFEPEELHDHGDDFCNSLNGLGPHNYQPALDIVGGTGIWMYCSQCGDYFHVDGSERGAGVVNAPAAAPQGSTPGPTPAPTTGKPWP